MLAVGDIVDYFEPDDNERGLCRVTVINGGEEATIVAIDARCQFVRSIPVVTGALEPCDMQLRLFNHHMGRIKWLNDIGILSEPVSSCGNCFPLSLIGQLPGGFSTQDLRAHIALHVESNQQLASQLVEYFPPGKTTAQYLSDMVNDRWSFDEAGLLACVHAFQRDLIVFCIDSDTVYAGDRETRIATIFQYSFVSGGQPPLSDPLLVARFGVNGRNHQFEPARFRDGHGLHSVLPSFHVHYFGDYASF